MECEMKNYEEKIFYFSAKWPEVFLGEKVDLDHVFPQTKANRKLYPLFIDSILNLRPLRHGDHMNKRPVGFRYFESEIYEKILNSYEYLSKVLNCETKACLIDIDGAIEEIEEIYKNLTGWGKGAYTKVIQEFMEEYRRGKFHC